MAGPGGGPPRKSHTKSRKGCKTCKKRHIRCDEQFPQCRNCTKHNCRCDYMDSPPQAEDVPRSPRGPDLLWTTSVEAEVISWLRTGIFPFAEIGLSTHDQFQGLSKIDLRLVHHLCTVYRDFRRLELLHCVAWVEKLPTFLDIAFGYDYVMSAILAFSATHLAWITKSTETTNMAYHYRGIALNGLHGAIGDFSEENSDPILAASILLSWQASDWGGWTSLMKGITDVVSAMNAWKDNSRLAHYVQSHVIHKPSSLMNSSMPPGRGLVLAEDDRSLQDAIFTLQRLQEYFPPTHPLRANVDEILQSAQEIEYCYATMPAQQLFEKLQRFRARMLWMPIFLVQGPENPNLNLLVIAHLYAVGISIDASIPELNGAAFGAMAAEPIEEISPKLHRGHSPTFQMSYESTRLDNMMHFPRQIAAKARFQHSYGGHGQESLASGQQSPYGFQNLRIASAPTTPGFPAAFPPHTNRSNEDLSVPPSPFLPQTYRISPTSPRHSQLFEQHSRSGSMTAGQRPFSGSASKGGDSPGYSPAYSPGLTFSDDDYRSAFGESSAGYHSGDSIYNESRSTGKQRRVS